jgi:hypothetical protein
MERVCQFLFAFFVLGAQSRPCHMERLVSFFALKSILGVGGYLRSKVCNGKAELVDEHRCGRRIVSSALTRIADDSSSEWEKVYILIYFTFSLLIILYFSLLAVQIRYLKLLLQVRRS